MQKRAPKISREHKDGKDGGWLCAASLQIVSKSYVEEKQREAQTWWQKLLSRFDIEYAVIEVAPTRAKKQVVTTLVAEQEKLELKLARLHEQVHEQITDWAIDDERSETRDQGSFDGTKVCASGCTQGSVSSINLGSIGFSKTSVGSSIIRRQKQQRWRR